MGLFKPDLYRNFALGFALGAVLVGVGVVDNWHADMATPAQAATAMDNLSSE
ncbi:hypothetical protein IM511_06460 [Erythrobacteraceae bacterium E2-1 Yellow Sea]|nr:hypothetical protein [Erythrobacteraceae bacterium E2-1 Yellow Sea]